MAGRDDYDWQADSLGCWELAISELRKRYLMLDWKRWPNFSEAEFACKHTGKCLMDPDFMDRLQKLRSVLGFSMPVTSGYRDASHPVEANKDLPGSHTFGRAADIGVRGQQAYHLVMVAGRLGFTGIGVKDTFIHLDDMVLFHAPRPFLWVYK